MAVDMMSDSQFLIFSAENNKDDSSLGRARSMTKTLAKKERAAIVPTNPINTEFSQVVNRLKMLQEEWRKRRMTRKVPIINTKHVKPHEFDKQDMQIKIETLKSERNQLNMTVASLFKQMQNLKHQNQNMSVRIEHLRKVLQESKSYVISLKHRNENLAEDMDAKAKLHEMQRRVWKTKIRASVSSESHIPPHRNHQSNGSGLQYNFTNHALGLSNNNNANINGVRGISKSITQDVLDLDGVLKEFETTIEKQREQLKYKNEQLEQQKSVFQYEKDQQYAELTKEINHLKHQRQQEIEELKIKLEQNNTELERHKQENSRLVKTLEVTNNELNANRKLIEASRPLNATQTEQQLFQLEQDYLNLSEILVGCQHRVTKLQNEKEEKQHELDDANRLIDEQNKTMQEYKKSIQLLQANLAESKSDQSDLINALQREWEQSKNDVMRYKQKCRQLQNEKDELIAQNLAREELQNQQQSQMQTLGGNVSSNNNGYNNNNNMHPPQQPNKSNHGYAQSANFDAYNYDYHPQQNSNHNHHQNHDKKDNDPELVVLLHDLQHKLTEKENEVKSQEMLMKQLMEQQKAFQKRNKTLHERLKAMKRDGRMNGNNGGKWDEGGGFDTGLNNNRYGNNYGGGGGGGYNNNQYNGPVPDTVNVEMKALYEHYVRNPIIQTNDIINKIRIKSAKIVGAGDNDYIIPEFNAMRINSPNTILIVIEDILVQRQNAINGESKKMKEIILLKESHQTEINKSEIDKKRLYADINRLQVDLKKYSSQIQELEEQKLFASNQDDNLVAEVEKLRKENERIAQEFLQGANIWNSEKAIMSAERAQIENDISYITHNLDQLILERQQFEEEADQFQGLYVNLLAHLREKGMQVEIEYVNEEDIKSQYSHLNGGGIKDDNSVSNRRKRNTMRLKLYQANTQSASLKEAKEPDDEESTPPPPRNADHRSVPIKNITIPSMKKQSSSPAVTHVSKKSNKMMKSYGRRNKNEPSTPQLSQPGSYGVSSPSIDSMEDRKRSLFKRVSLKNHKKVSDVMSHDDLSAPNSRNNSQSRNNDLHSIKEEHSRSAMKLRRVNSDGAGMSPSEMSNMSMSNIAPGSQHGVEDEADAYIPFDEPDEFNLLDEEYKKSAMDFVSVANNYLSQSLDAMNGDVNAMAQNVLSQELIRKQEKLPDLQGWMEKKSPTFARGWQKRWVIVREYNIFYGKNKCDIKDINDPNQKKKFLNAIPLLVVQYIVATDHSRSGRKFEIVARDPRTGDRRHYQWKASTREECDKWVHGLNAHKKLLAARLHFLANTGASAEQI